MGQLVSQYHSVHCLHVQSDSFEGNAPTPMRLCFCFMVSRVRSKIPCGFQGWSGALGNNLGQCGSGKRKGRHSAGFIAGAVCSVFHRLKARAGKQAEKVAGGAQEEVEGDSQQIEAHVPFGSRSGPAKSWAAPRCHPVAYTLRS